MKKLISSIILFLLALTLLSAWGPAIAQHSGPNPKIIVVIGEMGSGKSFSGKILAEKYGFHFYEGDLSIPPDMKRKVETFTPLVASDIDNFVTHHLIPKIEDLIQIHETVVVAQALYRNKHRQELLQKFGSTQLQFIFIQTPQGKHQAQLLSREGGTQWLGFAENSKAAFELPVDNGCPGQETLPAGTVKAYFIENKGDASFLENEFQNKLPFRTQTGL